MATKPTTTSKLTKATAIQTLSRLTYDQARREVIAMDTDRRDCACVTVAIGYREGLTPVQMRDHGILSKVALYNVRNALKDIGVEPADFAPSHIPALLDAYARRSNPTRSAGRKRRPGDTTPADLADRLVALCAKSGDDPARVVAAAVRRAAKAAKAEAA